MLFRSRLHFALRGPAEKAKLDVRWPSGRVTTHAVAAPAAGRTVVIREEDAK